MVWTVHLIAVLGGQCWSARWQMHNVPANVTGCARMQRRSSGTPSLVAGYGVQHAQLALQLLQALPQALQVAAASLPLQPQLRLVHRLQRQHAVPGAEAGQKRVSESNAKG